MVRGAPRKGSNGDEREALALSGWLVLGVIVIVIGWAIWSYGAILFAGRIGSVSMTPLIVAAGLVVFLANGFVVLQPNIAGVLTFVGRYTGSIREGGFHWINPLASLERVSLRIHNLNMPTLKVNDKAGNPVEVAAVIAWRVADTARATFDVENHEIFVNVQSESALRHVVSSRFYDGDREGRGSLRGDVDGVASELATSIQSNVQLAGIEIIEAKISHLAYAPEIAGAMLRRQQADAIVAARARIVHGAVSMVRLTLEQLQAQNIVQLEAADRVGLVRDLMTVLVSDSEAQPVLSVGRAGS